MAIDNPGEQLREMLCEIYPFDKNEKSSFVSRVDKAFISEGELAYTIYISTMNYMLRRLVTTAEYIKRTSSGDSSIYVSRIRRYIHDHTKFPSNKVEPILSLLISSIEARNKVISTTKKRKIKSEAKNQGLKCYICGREMTFEANDNNEKRTNAEVEHIWPRALGGASNEGNLTVACERCNKIKEDFIDAEDFHYEEICLVTDNEMEDFFIDFPWYYRVAVLAKSNFECVVCGQPAKHHGELQFERRDPSDSWHFLNIDAYCYKHSSRR